MCVPGLKIVSPVHPGRHAGPPGRRDPRRRPGPGVRAQGALRDEGRVPRHRARRARSGRPRSRAATPDGRRHPGRARAHRRHVHPCRRDPGRRGDRGRGPRPAHAGPPRRGRGARLRAAHRSRRHRRGEPRSAGLGRGASPRSSPRRRSTTSRARSLRVSGGNVPLPVATAMEAEVSPSRSGCRRGTAAARRRRSEAELDHAPGVPAATSPRIDVQQPPATGTRSDESAADPIALEDNTARG